MAAGTGSTGRGRLEAEAAKPRGEEEAGRALKIHIFSSERDD